MTLLNGSIWRRMAKQPAKCRPRPSRLRWLHNVPMVDGQRTVASASKTDLRSGPFSKSMRFYQTHVTNLEPLSLVARELPYLFDMLQARGADDHGVTVLAFEQAVVRNPAECNFRHGQIMLLGDLLNGRESLEVRLVPVPVATHEVTNAFLQRSRRHTSDGSSEAEQSLFV